MRALFLLVISYCLLSFIGQKQAYAISGNPVQQLIKENNFYKNASPLAKEVENTFTEAEDFSNTQPIGQQLKDLLIFSYALIWVSCFVIVKQAIPFFWEHPITSTRKYIIQRVLRL